MFSPMLKNTARAVCAIAMLGLQGCFYSFTGSSIQPDVKTLSVEQFSNNAATVQPQAAQLLTETVRDKFIQQSRLRLRQTNGDLQLSGVITRYDVAPAAIVSTGTGTTSLDRPALSRLTMTVKVRFENTKYPDQNWDKEFTQFVDFGANENMGAIESSRLLPDLNERLSQDIFSKALSNW